MMSTKKDLRDVLLFRGNEFIQVILYREVRLNKVGMILINPDLRLASETATLLRNLSFDHSEDLSDRELQWINREVKDFLRRAKYRYYIVCLLLDYLECAISLASGERLAMVDDSVMRNVQDYTRLKTEPS